MKRGEMREKILDVGEAMVQQRGMNGVSFRDIAEAIGVKSASVHYHFPSKDDFALALTERYSARFLAAGAEIARKEDSVADKIAAFGDLFLKAFQDDGKMCLCGILAAEASIMPEPVRLAIGNFFTANMDLLTDLLGDKSEARFVVTSLEGAMLLARAEGSPVHLQEVAKDLVAKYAEYG